MTKRYLGNIITQNPTAPAGPYENDAAPGVWSLAEALAYNKAGLWPTAGNSLDIAIFFTKQNRDIEVVQFSTLGNATDWGELLHDDASMATCGNNIVGMFMGGAGNRPEINQVTMAVGGVATDFGDLTIGRRLGAGLSNNTRGVCAGGENTFDLNRIDYITFATAGNAVDFGDCVVFNPQGGDAGGSNKTRGVYANSGGSSSRTNRIDYITIASTGNATDFGDRTQARGLQAAGNNSTRLIFGGGDSASDSPVNTIDYVTIASTGNAADFGDLTLPRFELGAASNDTRTLFAGGNQYPGERNTIDYVTTATTGNAADFGDLTRAQDGVRGVSSNNPSQAA